MFTDLKWKLSEQDQAKLKSVDFTALETLSSACTEQLKTLYAKLDYKTDNEIIAFTLNIWLKRVLDNRLHRDLTSMEKISDRKWFLQEIIDFYLSESGVVGKPTSCYVEHLLPDGHILPDEIIATDAVALLAQIWKMHGYKEISAKIPKK